MAKSPKELIADLGTKAKNDPRVKAVIDALQTRTQRATALSTEVRQTKEAAQQEIETTRQRATYAAAAAPLAGAFLGGSLDGSFGERIVNPSTGLGVVAVGAGVALNSPTAAGLGAGLASGASRRLGIMLGQIARQLVTG